MELRGSNQLRVIAVSLTNYGKINLLETSREGPRKIIPFNDTSIIIDINALSLTKTKRKYTKVKITASAQAFTENDGIAAYDGALHTYWLVENLPQHLQIEYPTTQKITHYTILSPWRGLNRSPKAWQLLGSNDGLNWDLVEERNNQAKWVEEVERKFVLKEASTYKYFRFLFTEINDFNYARKYLSINEIALFNGETPL